MMCPDRGYIPNGLPYTRFPHSPPDSLQPQLQHTQQATTLRGVGQDKPRPPHARIASKQPALIKKVMRAQGMDTNSPRVQKRSLQKSSSILAENLLLLL